MTEPHHRGTRAAAPDPVSSFPAPISRLARFRLWVAVCLLGAHLALQFAMAGRGDNPNVVFSDGVGYFSYIRSLAFDGDLDFGNEFRRLTSYSPSVERFWFENPLPDGRPRNIYAIGPGIFWSPFYLLGHVAAGLGPWPADGFSFPYQLAVVLGSFLYGLAGVFVLELLLRRFFDPVVAFVAAWSALLAGPVVYYMLFEPSMAHATDWFAVTLFLAFTVSFRERPPSAGRVFLLGLAVGVLFLVRWANALFLAWAALTVWRSAERGGPVRLAGWAVLLGAGFLAGGLPQFLIWKNLYGGYFVVPGGEGYFRWNPAAFWGTLFSWRNGLYVWTPVAAVATLGLFGLRGWRPLDLACFFAIFLGAVFVNSLVHDWWGGHSFGMRRLIGFFPFFAFGLAEAASRLKRFHRPVYLGLLGLIAWNGFLMVARKLQWIST